MHTWHEISLVDNVTHILTIVEGVYTSPGSRIKAHPIQTEQANTGTVTLLLSVVHWNIRDNGPYFMFNLRGNLPKIAELGRLSDCDQSNAYFRGNTPCYVCYVYYVFSTFYLVFHITNYITWAIDTVTVLYSDSGGEIRYLSIRTSL